MHDDWADAARRVGLDPAALSLADLEHNQWLTHGIWLVASPDQRMVLKCLNANGRMSERASDAHWKAGADDPRRWNYWAREALAYRDRAVDIYEPDGLVAPALLAAHYGDDRIVLLLEHVDGLPGEQWAVDHYARASHALGRAQGRLLAGPRGLDHPWLSRNFLRQYSAEKPVDWSLLDSDDAWLHPRVQRNFPGELRAAATWLHDASNRLYAIAEALPRVLCHLDFWPKNLIMRHDGNVALIDWAFVGDGAIGEDVGNLVPDAAFDHFVGAESLPELEAAVLDAYVDGLTTAGWSGDPRLAELGMCASAVKYDWLTPAMLASAPARQVRYGGTEEIDADYRFRERGIALLHNADRARRALTLADELDL